MLDNRQLLEWAHLRQPLPLPFPHSPSFSRDWRLFSQATIALWGPTMTSLGVHLLGTFRDLIASANRETAPLELSAIYLYN